MKSLDKRRDMRSIDVFAKNIKDFTQREFCWGVAFKTYLQENGFNCEILENGVDNSGSLIINELENNNPDKIFIFQDKKILVEIKTIPEHINNFFTFKVSSLISCLEHNAIILIPKKNEFFIILTQTINKLLEYPHKIYDRFSPNDLAIRIYKKDIEEMINNKLIIKSKWGNLSGKFIENNYNILFREKDK